MEAEPRNRNCPVQCRMRTPWYSVPDVRVPDFFLTYMSGRMPNLVRNRAAATCTNAVHGVHLHDRKAVRRVTGSWETPFVRLSCELEGHPLGGGVLKLEPREATRIVLPPPAMASALSGTEVVEAVAIMCTWRHYDAAGGDDRFIATIRRRGVEQISSACSRFVHLCTILT